MPACAHKPDAHHTRECAHLRKRKALHSQGRRCLKNNVCSPLCASHLSTSSHVPLPSNHPRTAVGVIRQFCWSGLPYCNRIELSAPTPQTPLTCGSILTNLGTKRCPRQRDRRGMSLTVLRGILPSIPPLEVGLQGNTYPASAAVSDDASPLSIWEISKELPGYGQST